MIDNVVYIIIMSCLLISELLYTISFFRASWYYFTDGADMRVCSLAQYFVYGILFTTEVINYLITGQTSILFIFVARSHLTFSFFLLASCRLIGYRIMYSSPILRNILYIIICFFFYFTTIMGCITLNLDNINSEQLYGNFQRLSQVSLYIQNLTNYPSHVIVEFIPIIYSLACFGIIISFDLKEKRSLRTIIMDVFLGISILLFMFAKIGTTIIYLDNVIVCIMYILPIFGFVSESKSVLRMCRLLTTGSEKFRKLVSDSIKLPSLRKKYNARIIAKLIDENPELENQIPCGKKYSEFASLVKSFRKGG